MTDKYGVLAVGNAIVDIIAQVDESVLDKHGMTKGAMALIDQETAQKIYQDLPNPIQTSGGSAGNTMAAYASLGGTGAYIGKTGNDELGQEFRDDITSQGVTFTTPPLNGDTPTAFSMIIVTPDAQRTMNTYLGAAGLVTTDDIDEDLIKNSAVTYLEGYLFDRDESKEAFYKASELTKKHGKKLALTLSDTFCVERFKSEFKNLVENHVDILFANENEILSLYDTANFDDAMKQLQNDVEIGAVTRSEKGAVITSKEEIITVPAVPPTQLVDTSGAGDSYAAGFLYGYTQEKTLAECSHIGAVAASEVISHIGPRPQQDLSALLKAA